MKSENANQLAHETSPYLLQHAYNPVDWYPWGKEALEKARQEDKPMLVSIGYSACHWCHVMERESFEDSQIAAIMNQNFICIKVDREERPDVDQIYMDAIQNMGLQGGWPMNVFLTPEQKPFYGGTYFPPAQWAQLMENVAHAFKNNRHELDESAEKFTESLNLSEVQKYGLQGRDEKFDPADLSQVFEKMAPRFDRQRGGMNKAPKFPMPSIWLFMLRYYAVSNNKDALQQVQLTLDQMAFGGIYDQIGGGFARYSVDGDWFAPHFEKMLYDNGQLLSLYAEAYNVTKKTLYKEVVYETIEWLEREMLSPEGGFYAALDADSEGEEGRFYVWKADEVEAIFGKEAELLIDYYGLSHNGNWEHGNNILNRDLSDKAFAEKYGLDVTVLKSLVVEAKQKMLETRSLRVRPGLDDKILTGWNGLMLKGLCDAFAVFGEERFLYLAFKNAEFIEKNLLENQKLKRTFKNGKANLDGYLEDYAFVMEAFISLYQVSFQEKWLVIARELADYSLENFYDPEESLFFYTDSNGEKLIARKKELFDNVIPSSNAAMAKNLYFLGLMLDQQKFTEIAQSMASKVIPLIEAEPEYLSYWATYLTNMVKPTAEIAIVGPDCKRMRAQIEKIYYPNKVVMGAVQGSELPLLIGKAPHQGKTTIFVCYNKTCKLPVHTVEEAFLQLK